MHGCSKQAAKHAVGKLATGTAIESPNKRWRTVRMFADACELKRANTTSTESTATPDPQAKTFRYAVTKHSWWSVHARNAAIINLVDTGLSFWLQKGSLRRFLADTGYY